MCQLSGDAWLSVATAGISTMAECWASLAEAIVQGKTAKKQASVIVFILGSFLVWEQRERDELLTTRGCPGNAGRLAPFRDIDHMFTLCSHS